jgi:hypothetical protein
LLASFQRRLSIARFTSVDLVDAPFASLPNHEVTEEEEEVGPLPSSGRPDHTKMIPWRMV